MAHPLLSWDEGHTKVPFRSSRSVVRTRRRLYRVAAASALILLAIVLVVRTRPLNHIEPAAPSIAFATQGELPVAAIFDEDSVAPGRPVYRYSVVPGGTYTGDELIAAIENDRVVAAHYQTLDRTRLRKEVVPRDRYVHVSYRKGNDVLWTKKQVLLRKGETILTDGTTQVRARCGNCISDQPLGPTADDEPETVEFDRLVDAPPPAAPDVALVQPATPATAGAITGPVPPGAGVGGFGGLGAATALGAGSSAGGGGASAPLVRATPASQHEPESILPTDFVPPLDDVLFPGDGSTPLAGSDPFPSGPFGPAGPGDPSGPGSYDQPELPGGPGPINPTPVPEPGTLLLVGGGVAALIRKYRLRGNA